MAKTWVEKDVYTNMQWVEPSSKNLGFGRLEWWCEMLLAHQAEVGKPVAGVPDYLLASEQDLLLPTTLIINVYGQIWSAFLRCIQALDLRLWLSPKGEMG